MSTLPTGTVTFLFTDIEGSTRLLEAQPEAYRRGLARHDAIVRQAVAAHEGVVVQHRGDGFCAAFASPTAATLAALDSQRALQAEPSGEVGRLRARMALHTGEVEVQGEEYFGAPLHRCARLMDSAHGDQVVLSAVTVALVGEVPPAGVWFKDLGEHRLRDLAQPEHVYQLVAADLPAEFPALWTLAAASNNLPPQTTVFVGREREIQTVRDALLRPETRLLTLTGPGGTGKTRLSLQVAADALDSFPDGVFFVALASVTDPELVSSSVAQALGVREAPGRPIMVSLGDALRQKRMLLVLDNFEQVIDAAQVVADLLIAAPRLKILVTSRAALRLYGERELAVPPLTFPDRRAAPTAAHLSRFESVRLFVERAQAVRSDLALVDENAADIAEICHRLDGLPLAIELAAARVRVLPIPALLQRMERRLPLLTGGARDLPARQRTLRDTIAWSYDLLEPAEQALFRRLAVFHGCTLETAEAVCAGELPRPGATSVALPPLDVEVLDGVESLVEKSLLRQEQAGGGQARYLMLETVREFSLARLAESGEEDAVRRRHILAMVSLAESSESGLYGPEQAVWFARLEQEHDNIRTALAWSEERGYAVPAIRIASALWWFWAAHGHVKEGRARLSSLLARFPTKASSARATLGARALYGAAILASIQGDHAAARALYEEELALHRALDDQDGAHAALEGLGTAACFQGDYVAALHYYREALALARDLEIRAYTATLHGLGNVSYELGDLSEARARFEEVIALLQTEDDARRVAAAWLSLAAVTQEDGEYGEARAQASRARTLFERAGDPRQVALAVASLASIAFARGEYAEARDSLRTCLAMQQQLGDTAGIAMVLERLIGPATAQGQFERAIWLAAAATALREQTGAPLPANGQARLERALEPARRALGEQAVEAAWREGRTLDPDQAVQIALATAEDAVSASGEKRDGESDGTE